MTANSNASRRPSAAARIAELEAQLAESNAKLAEAEAAKAAATKASHESGYKGYATKEISPAVNRFVEWLLVEYPELYPSVDAIDVRLVFIANKAYSHFQKSNANRDASGKALGRRKTA